MSRGYVIDCLLKPRKGETLFEINGDIITPRLQGYAIIPKEEFLELKALKDKQDAEIAHEIEKYH
jgi:hypothetical protein